MRKRKLHKQKLQVVLFRDSSKNPLWKGEQVALVKSAAAGDHDSIEAMIASPERAVAIIGSMGTSEISNKTAADALEAVLSENMDQANNLLASYMTPGRRAELIAARGDLPAVIMSCVEIEDIMAGVLSHLRLFINLDASMSNVYEGDKTLEFEEGELLDGYESAYRRFLEKLSGTISEVILSWAMKLVDNPLYNACLESEFVGYTFNDWVIYSIYKVYTNEGHFDSYIANPDGEPDDEQDVYGEDEDSLEDQIREVVEEFGFQMKAVQELWNSRVKDMGIWKFLELVQDNKDLDDDESEETVQAVASELDI